MVGTTICLIFELVLLKKLNAVDDKVYVMKRISMKGKAKQATTTRSPPSKQQPIVSNVPIKEEDSLKKNCPLLLIGTHDLYFKQGTRIEHVTGKEPSFKGKSENL